MTTPGTTPSPDEIFNVVDHIRSKLLPYPSMDHLFFLFCQHDKNHDGVLNRDEALLLLHEYKCLPPDVNLSSAIKSLLTDASQQVRFGTLYRFMLDEKERYPQSFESMDGKQQDDQQLPQRNSSSKKKQTSSSCNFFGMCGGSQQAHDDDEDEDTHHPRFGTETPTSAFYKYIDDSSSGGRDEDTSHALTNLHTNLYDAAFEVGVENIRREARTRERRERNHRETYSEKQYRKLRQSMTIPEVQLLREIFDRTVRIRPNYCFIDTELPKLASILGYHMTHPEHAAAKVVYAIAPDDPFMDFETFLVWWLGRRLLRTK